MDKLIGGGSSSSANSSLLPSSGKKKNKAKYVKLASADPIATNGGVGAASTREDTLSNVPSILDINQNIQNNINASDALISPPEPGTYINPLPPVTPVSTSQFLDIIEEVKAAINDGIYPSRISQGSSGSYFCRDRKGTIVGVFKPKNEEPYGHLNPKWTKWIHKNLFPCCFGRSCIIPNLGYISEAAASYLDRRLQLNIVPRTEVVSLASPTFYYSLEDKKAHRNGAELPAKIGSFQLFLNGYKDATTFFKEGYEQVFPQNNLGSEDARTTTRASAIPPVDNPAHPLNWSQQTQREFQMGFERLVVLDYIIRNTDRGSDNWMVRFNGTQQQQSTIPNSSKTNDGAPSSPSTDTDTDQTHSATLTGENNVPMTNIQTGVGKPQTSQSEPLFNLHNQEDDEDDEIESLNRALDAQSTESLIPTAGTSSNVPIFSAGKKPPLADHNKTTLGNDLLRQEYVESVSINVAAIDNGLAFPYKHPDRWRSYPYGWSFLPISRMPFTSTTRNQVLHLLTSQEWWRETLQGLERLFRLDVDFSSKMWKKQKAIIRGQGYNLVESLRRSQLGDTISGSPAGLLRRPVVAVYDEDDDNNEDFLQRQQRRLRRVTQRFETFTREQPCFSWC